MDINERIRRRRKELGLSAEEIALIIGVSPATIYRYESADILNMGIDKIEPIAKALKTTPAYIMGWESDNSIADSNRVSEECEPYSVLSCAIPVSDDENELLCAYRSATEKGRNMAMGILISNQEEEVFRSQKQA